MKLQGTKIAFLGDSITQGSGASDVEHAYWNVIGQKTGAKVYGYGIGGTRIAPNRIPSPVPEFDAHYASRVDSMIPDAEIVVVFGGTNDFGHGDAALGTMEDRDENTFYGSMHVLCRKLMDRYPEAMIVVLTPLHRLGDTDCTYNEYGIRRQVNLEGYVDAIMEVAAYYAIPVLDLFRTSRMNPAVPYIQEHYMPDGLHPSDAGHERLADCVIRFLEAL